VRGSVRSAARGNMISTVRGKATHIASRGSRAQSIPGLKERNCMNKKKTIKAHYFPSDSCFCFLVLIKEFLFIRNNFTLAFTLIISGYEECFYKDTYLFDAGSIWTDFIARQ
jgi:hypothetical protein